MRAGLYAVVDGVEYQADRYDGRVLIYLPVASRDDGWDYSGSRRQWVKSVEVDQVTEMTHVSTTATLDTVDVTVAFVRPGPDLAMVEAPAPGSNFAAQRANKPHPEMEEYVDSPYGISHWCMLVDWVRLTGVHEESRKEAP